MQIWWETKPHRLLLRPATSITWTSTPFTTNDKALMDITTTVYDKCSSQIIKKCWILLQGFFLVDLLFFYQQTVHLAYDEGEAPPSCIPSVAFYTKLVNNWHFKPHQKIEYSKVNLSSCTL